GIPARAAPPARRPPADSPTPNPAASPPERPFSTGIAGEGRLARRARIERFIPRFNESFEPSVDAVRRGTSSSVKHRVTSRVYPTARPLGSAGTVPEVAG